MFSKFHIYRGGSILCHGGGNYIQFEEASGMNPQNCCVDCLRRYVNIARMLKVKSDLLNPIDKALLRKMTE